MGVGCTQAVFRLRLTFACLLKDKEWFCFVDVYIGFTIVSRKVLCMMAYVSNSQNRCGLGVLFILF